MKQFEASPLANEKKSAKEELQKVEIQLQIVKANIQVMERNLRDYKIQKERKLQKDIIQIAKMWLIHRDNVENLKILKQEDAELKQKIAEQKIKIEALIKEKEDEEKQKALARFLMPPPIMDLILMEAIMSQYSQPNVAKKHSLSNTYHSLYKNKESVDDSDSVSISSSLYEMNITENQTSTNAQETEQVHNDPDTSSLLSSRDYEITKQNSQHNLMMYSAEESPREILRSPEKFTRSPAEKSPQEIVRSAKSIPGSSQTPHGKTQTENPTFEKSDTIKRPANSPQESNIRKKSHDEHSKTNINPKEKNLQDKNSLNLETMKNIQENVRRQGKGPDTPVKIVPERKEISEVNPVFPERIENLENTLLLSPNASFIGSVNSINFIDRENNGRGAGLDLNSDISIQSNLDDANNSVVFSEDENSISRSDNNLNDTNAVNPAPPAMAPMGMFASQNRGFFNFQGFFSK